MDVMIARSLGELPDTIQTALQKANAYYSAGYEQYIRSEASESFYVYNDAFVQIGSIHRIKNIFRVAALHSEPFCWKEIQPETCAQTFLDEVLLVLKRQLKADWLTVTPASSLFTAYPTCSERIKFGNYIVDLSKDEDGLMAGMDSKHRNMVRRGERGGIEVIFGGIELLNDYILLDKQTWERSDQTVDHTDYYKKYIEMLYPNVIVGIGYKDGVPQCGLIGMYNKCMFYYMFGASAHRPEPGSTHYLQWQTMLKMKAEGVLSYNFVGCRINEDKNSKYHNIQHFKKGFGGVLQECYLFRATLNKPRKMLFDMLMQLKTGKKPQDVIDQEIHKWSEINQTERNWV